MTLFSRRKALKNNKAKQKQKQNKTKTNYTFVWILIVYSVAKFDLRRIKDSKVVS